MVAYLGMKYDEHKEKATNASNTSNACNAELAMRRDMYYMRLALKEAQQAAALGEVPVGAVCVQTLSTGERIIATAHNLREITCDPSAHAEFLALTQAAQQLKRWRLGDCTIYVTLEPCLMCAGLMLNARVSKVVFGAADPKGGALGSLYDVHADKRLNHAFELTSGILQEESAGLLKEFFKARR